jgi:hypothetical protein
MTPVRGCSRLRRTVNSDRRLEQIEADIRAVEQDIVRILAEVTGSR